MRLNKFTDKQQKRDLKLDNTLGYFRSSNSKQMFNPGAGLTTAGISTKKESRLTEDLENTINREILMNKL